MPRGAAITARSLTLLISWPGTPHGAAVTVNVTITVRSLAPLGRWPGTPRGAAVTARLLAWNDSWSVRYRSLPRSDHSLAWNASRSSRYHSLTGSARLMASNASLSSCYRSLHRSARSLAWNASRPLPFAPSLRSVGRYPGPSDGAVVTVRSFALLGRSVAWAVSRSSRYCSLPRSARSVRSLEWLTEQSLTWSGRKMEHIKHDTART